MCLIHSRKADNFVPAYDLPRYNQLLLYLGDPQSRLAQRTSSAISSNQRAATTTHTPPSLANTFPVQEKKQKAVGHISTSQQGKILQERICFFSVHYTLMDVLALMQMGKGKENLRLHFL